jgi:hypothetical protein
MAPLSGSVELAAIPTEKNGVDVKVWVSGLPTVTVAAWALAAGKSMKAPTAEAAR